VRYVVRLIDDATSFVERDSTPHNRAVLWEYLEKNGRMLTVPPQPGQSEQERVTADRSASGQGEHDGGRQCVSGSRILAGMECAFRLARRRFSQPASRLARASRSGRDSESRRGARHRQRELTRIPHLGHKIMPETIPENRDFSTRESSISQLPARCRKYHNKAMFASRRTQLR